MGSFMFQGVFMCEEVLSVEFSLWTQTVCEEIAPIPANAISIIFNIDIIIITNPHNHQAQFTAFPDQQI